MVFTEKPKSTHLFVERDVESQKIDPGDPKGLLIVHIAGVITRLLNASLRLHTTLRVRPNAGIDPAFQYSF